MRVYFVIPDIKGIVEKPTSPQLGVGYLAAVLLKNNHEVKVLDARLGYDDKYVLSKVKEFGPDFVGVTCVSMGYKNTYKLIDFLSNDGFKVIVGGPHVSITRRKILEECRADIAVKGEAENTIVEICSGKNIKDIEGVIWRDGKNIIENPDRKLIHNLDSIPFPAFHLFELDKYMDKKLPIATSRGCPYGCTFCSIRLTMGRGFRPRSPKNVVDELVYWNKKLRYDYFGFNDDCFNLDIDRAKKICHLIIKRNLKIRWELRNGIRVDSIDEELLRNMKRAGCIYVSFGVESANQDVIDFMKKGITPEQAKKAIQLTDKVGIKIGAFFIIGLPKEDFKKFKNSLKFALSLPLDEVRFYNPIPFPGTELFEWVKGNAHLIMAPEVYLNSVGSFDYEPIYETNDFPLEQRRRAYRMAENYFMKYLIRREFGSFIGMVGWLVWKPRITRKFIMNLGKKVWTFKRMVIR